MPKNLRIIGVLMGLLFLESICTASELSYDNGSVLGHRARVAGWPTCANYYGVRFTPTQNCQVTAGKIELAVTSAAICSAFVYSGTSTVPSARKDQKAFTPTTGWNTITFSNPPSFNKNANFFILFFVNPGGTVGIGIDGDGLTNSTRMVKADVIPTWYWGNDAGDYMIRAEVTYIGIEEQSNIKTTSNTMLKASPNPFVRSTVISYQSDKETAIRIYDITGKLVKSFPMLQSSDKQITNLTWDTKDNNGKKVSAGMYFCKLKAGKDILTKTLVIL